MTRRISSSRPMTGSSLPAARAARSGRGRTSRAPGSRLRVLARHALAASIGVNACRTDRLVDSQAREQAPGAAVRRRFQDRQQQVLGRNVLVVHPLRDGMRVGEDPVAPHPKASAGPMRPAPWTASRSRLAAAVPRRPAPDRALEDRRRRRHRAARRGCRAGGWARAAGCPRLWPAPGRRAIASWRALRKAFRAHRSSCTFSPGIRLRMRLRERFEVALRLVIERRQHDAHPHEQVALLTRPAAFRQATAGDRGSPARSACSGGRAA